MSYFTQLLLVRITFESNIIYTAPEKFAKKCAQVWEDDAMRVLLCNPEFEETYWSFRYALPFEGKRSVFPPLSLLTVSSLLPRDCERRLVDLNIERLKDAQIEWADMVFITGMLAQKESLHEVVQRLLLSQHRSEEHTSELQSRGLISYA